MPHDLHPCRELRPQVLGVGLRELTPVPPGRQLARNTAVRVALLVLLVVAAGPGRGKPLRIGADGDRSGRTPPRASRPPG
ncbi:hypothetical protein ABMX48_00090 [Streptomyces cavourensis]